VAEWIDFDPAKWAVQQHPPERKLVVVQLPARPDKGLPPAVAVGYLRYAAGCKDSPMFVTPGIGGIPVAWCDCLPQGFGAPLWPGYTPGVPPARKITSLAEFCSEGARLGLTAFDLAEALKDRPEFADCKPPGVQEVAAQVQPPKPWEADK
jgi:hypothetical protein